MSLGFFSPKSGDVDEDEKVTLISRPFNIFDASYGGQKHVRKKIFYRLESSVHALR